MKEAVVISFPLGKANKHATRNQPTSIDTPNANCFQSLTDAYCTYREVYICTCEVVQIWIILGCKRVSVWFVPCVGKNSSLHAAIYKQR